MVIVEERAPVSHLLVLMYFIRYSLSNEFLAHHHHGDVGMPTQSGDSLEPFTGL